MKQILLQYYKKISILLMISVIPEKQSRIDYCRQMLYLKNYILVFTG